MLGISVALSAQSLDPALHQQILDENKGWMTKAGLGKELPPTYQAAVASLMDSIIANGQAGTPENPAQYKGFLMNGKLKTTYLATNVKPGVWEISVEKPIYGEKDFPKSIVISKVGVIAKFHD